MADFTLRQLEYFVATARSGSITEAAGRLHVSHTAVSTALTELERQLDNQLFVRRKGRGITLTTAGAHVLDHAESLLAQADELVLDLTSRDGTLVGPLRVGCFSTLAPTIASALWAAYREAHPRVDLAVEVGSQSEIPDRLLSGELDLAVVYDSELPGGLRSVTLSSPAPHVLLPADHRLSALDRVSLLDLADEPMVEFDARPSVEHNRRLFREAGVEPNVAVSTPDFELTRSLVARGFGYALLHQRPAVDSSYEGRGLVALPVEGEPSSIRILMAWVPDARMSARSRAMIDLAAGMDFTRITPPPSDS